MTFNLINVPCASLQTTEGKYNLVILHVPSTEIYYNVHVAALIRWKKEQRNNQYLVRNVFNSFLSSTISLIML